jgi:hypothetical protein
MKGLYGSDATNNSEFSKTYTFEDGATFGAYFNPYKLEITFYHQGKFLGLGFKNINSVGYKKLFPIVECFDNGMCFKFIKPTFKP